MIKQNSTLDSFRALYPDKWQVTFPEKSVTFFCFQISIAVKIPEKTDPKKIWLQMYRHMDA